MRAAMVPAASMSWALSYGEAAGLAAPTRRWAHDALTEAAHGAQAYLAAAPRRLPPRELVASLIEQGADPCQDVCAPGCLESFIAVAAPELTAVQALELTAAEWFSPLRIAVLGGDLAAVQALLPPLAAGGDLATFDGLVFDADQLVLGLVSCESTPAPVRAATAGVHECLVDAFARAAARSDDEAHRLVAHLTRQQDHAMLARVLAWGHDGPRRAAGGGRPAAARYWPARLGDRADPPGPSGPGASPQQGCGPQPTALSEKGRAA